MEVHATELRVARLPAILHEELKRAVRLVGHIQLVVLIEVDKPVHLPCELGYVGVVGHCVGG